MVTQFSLDFQLYRKTLMIAQALFLNPPILYI